MDVEHLVMFSGGAGSFCAAERIIEQHGRAGVVLLFADTLIEDATLYSFIDAAAEFLRVPLVKICEGRTPWQVFKDERFLGNSRVDPCSRLLKRGILNKWRAENCRVESTSTVIGVDISEVHRFKNMAARSEPWRVAAPLCEPPFLNKTGMLKRLKVAGLEVPRLYGLGMPHNNCGGFCCKAGQGHFVKLLEVLPDVFAEAELHEEDMRQYLNRDVAFLKDRRGGDVRPLTLRELRERVEEAAARETEVQLDLFDWGGCGCAID